MDSHVESWDDSDFDFSTGTSPFKNQDTSDSEPENLFHASLPPRSSAHSRGSEELDEFDPDLDGIEGDKANTIKAAQTRDQNTLRQKPSQSTSQYTPAALLLKDRLLRDDHTDDASYGDDYTDLPASLERVGISPPSKLTIPTSQASDSSKRAPLTPLSSNDDGSTKDEDDLFGNLILPPFLGGPGVATPPSSVESKTSQKMDLQGLVESNLKARVEKDRATRKNSSSKVTVSPETPRPTTARKNALTPTASCHTKQNSSENTPATVTSRLTTPTLSSRLKHREKSTVDPSGRATSALGRPMTPSRSPTRPTTALGTENGKRKNMRNFPPTEQPHIVSNTPSTRPASEQSSHKFKRVRHQFTGAELDNFDDLPVDTSKESRFVKVPKRVPSSSATNLVTPQQKVSTSPETKKTKPASTLPDRTQKRQSQEALGYRRSDSYNSTERTPRQPEGRPRLKRDVTTTASRVKSSMKPALITNYSAASNPQDRFGPNARAVSTSVSINKAAGGRTAGKMVFDPVQLCWRSQDPEKEEILDLESSFDEEKKSSQMTTGSAASTSQQFQNTDKEPRKGVDPWTGGETSRLKKKKSFISTTSATERHKSTSSASTLQSSIGEEGLDLEMNDRDYECDIPCSLNWDAQGYQFWQECQKAELRHEEEMKNWRCNNSSNSSSPSRHDTKSYLWSIRKIVMDQ